MGRGRNLPRIVEDGFRGKVGAPKPPVPLAGLRSPGSRYVEQRPMRPSQDPLQQSGTTWPYAPDRYRSGPRYDVSHPKPYLHPTGYETPTDESWDYAPLKMGSMFDGRALDVFDAGPPREDERLSRQAVQQIFDDWDGASFARQHASRQADLAARLAEPDEDETLRNSLETMLGPPGGTSALELPELSDQYLAPSELELMNDALGADIPALGAADPPPIAEAQDEFGMYGPPPGFEDPVEDGAMEDAWHSAQHAFNEQADEMLATTVLQDEAFGFDEPTAAAPGHFDPLELPPPGAGPGRRWF